MVWWFDLKTSATVWSFGTQNHRDGFLSWTSKPRGGGVIEPPLEMVHRLKINQGILDEARMHKHTYEAYKDMIKVEIKLLQLCLRFTRH
jgi:hypothetical protein